MDHKIITRIAIRIAEEEEPVTPAEIEEIGIKPRWAQIRTLVQSELFPLFKQLRIITKNQDEIALTNIYEQILKHLARLSFLMGMTSVKTKIQNIKNQTFE